MGTASGNFGRVMYKSKEYKEKMSKSKTFNRIFADKICPCCLKTFQVERTLNKNGEQHINKKERICCSQECSHLYAKDKNHIVNEDTRKKQKAISEEKFIWFYEFKRNYHCEICGNTKIYLLTFHHKEKNLKENDIKTLARRADKSLFYKEIEKCQCLCYNCHMEVHFKEQHPELFLKVVDKVY